MGSNEEAAASTILRSITPTVAPKRNYTAPPQPNVSDTRSHVEQLREELDNATEEELMFLSAHDTAQINDSCNTAILMDSVAQLEKIKLRHERLTKILALIEGKSEIYQAFLLPQIIRQVKDLGAARCMVSADDTRDMHRCLFEGSLDDDSELQV